MLSNYKKTKKLCIGVTGQTGAGKSSVCSLLSKIGFTIINADSVAHQILESDDKCKKMLVDAFSDKIVDTNLNIDRKMLAYFAFKSHKKTDTLNSIMLPLITLRIEKLIKNQLYDNNVAIDAALLFESGLNSICDKIICIIAPENIRLSRIVTRDSISEREAQMRISSQKDERFYTKNSDFVLDGTLCFEELFKKLTKILGDKY